jgi:PAS domain S-box-containing protein
MSRTPLQATFRVGPLSQIEEVDAGACALLGYSRGELLSMHGSDLVLAQDRPVVAMSVNEMRLGVLAHSQGRLLRKDGSLVSVDVTGHPLGEGRVELRVVSLES